MLRLPLAATLALCLMALGSPSVGQAQNQLRILPAKASIEPVENSALATLLQRGQKLEIQRRWAEALTLYEDALRDHPNEHTLSERHDLAKIHYDLGRRCNDLSFNKSMQALSDREALSLYSEVLVKLQSHYVTEPDWNALFQHGLRDLEVALEDPAFLQRHLPSALEGNELSSDFQRRLAAFKRQVDSLGQGPAARGRGEVVERAGQVQRLAQQRLNLSATAVGLEFACGAMSALDEYSSFLTSDQLNDVYSQIEGNFVGLGIELKSSGTGLLIVKVITGSPAERGGLVAGDRIMAVDGQGTAKMSTDQAANLLQGEEGSSVEISVVGADNQTRALRLRREHVEVPSVDLAQILDKERGIAYLRLTCFQKTTSKDLDAAMWKLNREGMKSLIIDLRGNPGGLLTASVEVADKFLDEGVIVSTHGRSAVEEFVYSAHKPGTWHLPLVVLIDGDSASASEIFAGAIRDHQRGVIVGQRSYGKGSVQGIFPLGSAGAGVRLTTAKFFSPSGKPISKVGVTPHTVVQSAAKPVDGTLIEPSANGNDPVIREAIQAAARQSAPRHTTRKAA